MRVYLGYSIGFLLNGSLTGSISATIRVYLGYRGLSN